MNTYTDTQYGNFWGNALYQATKQRLNNREAVKNSERKRLTLFWLSFYSLFSVWKIVGINLPSAEQAVKTQPKQDKTFSFIFHHFWPFLCCLSVILWLDKGDFPENVHTVSVLK